MREDAFVGFARARETEPREPCGRPRPPRPTKSAQLLVNKIIVKTPGLKGMKHLKSF